MQSAVHDITPCHKNGTLILSNWIEGHETEFYYLERELTN